MSGSNRPDPAGDSPDLSATLRRQLRRLGMDPLVPPRDAGRWAALLAAVDAAYRESRHDIYLLQRSLALVSTEMTELADQVRSTAQAELSLADRQIRRLALAVEASVDAIVITDPRAIIEYVNPAFTAVTGWERDEALGQNPRILKSGRTAPATYQQMWETLRRGELWSGRLRNRRKATAGDPSGGREYWAATTIAPYFDSDGVTLLGYVAIQRDITDAVALEDRHRLAARVSGLRADIAAHLQCAGPFEARLSAAASDISSALAEITGANWDVVVDVGVPGAMASSGPTPPVGWPAEVQERLGRALVGLHHPVVMPATSRPDASRAMRPSDWSVLLAPAGPEATSPTLLACFCAGQPQVDSALVESLALAAELTSLAAATEQAHRELKAARDAAESATRAKAQFLATMSHEIRTPMNGVIGMLDLLAESALNAPQREQITLARTSAGSLLTIINDILDFSKIEAGKIELESLPFDVRALTREVTALSAAQAIGRAVSVTAVIDAAVPDRLRGDPTRLRQILTNVIGNAVKFTSHGVVRVAVRRAPPRRASTPVASPPGGEPDPVALEFEVSDTGIGMDAGTISSLFRPFSQADASTTRRFGGTGLGLAITGQLVELMRGQITVSSEPGSGTRFVVTLPFGVADVELPAPVAPSDSCEVVGRVLLVEDNVINQKVARSMLARLGLAVEVAGDGQQALAKLAADDHFGLVLMDCQMPVLDGFAATRAYRAIEAEGRHLPIIALTANALMGAQEECWAAGMDGYLSKPYTRDELAAVVHRYLG